jgi:2-polyprenyl-3-methyl-5-hydroxy-6-metoxy-1,4-benzoquinol methylase
MQRVVEPELMDDARQVLAYAQADFSEPNSHFVELLKQHHGDRLKGSCLDLGCGPGDICFRLAKQFPGLYITGVDGSAAMLEYARQSQNKHDLIHRVAFEQHRLPSDDLLKHHFDVITSNSLLHHLHTPRVLWQTIRQCGKAGGIIHVMDLYRPQSERRAAQIVETYAAEEPQVLKEDFYHSLLAAFSPAEIESQLHEAGLTGLTMELISDRHILISGVLEH